MAVLQSTFVEDTGVGYAGMEADGELSNIISRTLEGTDPCPFGSPVYRGADPKGCDLTPEADKLYGFALANPGLPLTADRDAGTYAPLDTIRIKERGKLWVDCSTAATQGQPVYVTTGGDVSNSSGGGNIAATGWVFEDTITGAGLVRIVRR